jgi:hypothetical protein
MLRILLDLLMGCTHRRTTFPQTPVRKVGIVDVKSLDDMCRQTYVVCLDCGKEFGYDWEGMSVGKALERGGQEVGGAGVPAVARRGRA